MLVIFGLIHLEIIPTYMLAFVIIKEKKSYLFIYYVFIYYFSV